MKNVLNEFREKIGGMMPRKRSPKNIALLIDGPNVLRREFNIKLADVKQELLQYGIIKIAKIYLDQYAPEKLIEAVTNIGFEPIIASTDVDVLMAVEATELIFNPHIDILALMTRDADFQPVVNKAKIHGKETLVIGLEPGFAAALKNSADQVIDLSKLR